MNDLQPDPMEHTAHPPQEACDILALGEPMVEFNQTGGHNGRHYLQGFGGDTSNFAIAAARQGARVGFLSALGDDPYGQWLRQLWRDEGVDQRSVLTKPEAYTAIYFVTHTEQGHAFHFFRKGSAASQMTPADLPRQRIAAAKVLHLSGISLAISANALETGLAAMEHARASGVPVSFDTNLRLKLWPIERARPAMVQALMRCDIALPSEDDIAAIIGPRTPDGWVDACLEMGAKVVALKMGANGALVANANERHRIPALPVRSVDATGAGDTFGGAFISQLVAGEPLLQSGRYAAAAAALSTQGYGAVDPIPKRAQVLAALAQWGAVQA